MPALMAIADDVYSSRHLCSLRFTGVSHRLVADEKQVLIGEMEEYDNMQRVLQRSDEVVLVNITKLHHT